jgi:prevent-host-death family protein
MQTMRVGIRDAKIHLSKLLKMVQQGGEIILTDRGRPVGKIVPIESAALPLAARLERLENQGILQPVSSGGTKPIPPPISLSDDIAQQFLQTDRSDEWQ